MSHPSVTAPHEGAPADAGSPADGADARLSPKAVRGELVFPGGDVIRAVDEEDNPLTAAPGYAE